MDVSLRRDDLRRTDDLVRPWRTAAILAGAVAAVELLVLVVVGGALLANPSSGPAAKPISKRAAAHAAVKSKHAIVHRAAAPAAHLTRGKVSVLVLNGNGRQGAARSTATRISRRGYRISAVANAPRSDFTRNLVMYRRGFEGEARRLARDLGIRIVGPLDGMRAAQLHGAHAVVVVGG